MNIEITKYENDIIIGVSGRLDTTTAPTLETAINDNITTCKTITLDLNGLNYISSAGLRVLLTTQKKIKTTGTMKLINVSSDIMEVFEIVVINTCSSCF